LVQKMIAGERLNEGLLEGAPLGDRAEVPRQQRRSTKAVAACALAAVLGAPLYVGSVQQSSAASATSLRAAASKVWSPDQPGAWETQAWEAMFNFKLPYMDFVTDVYVHADQDAGLMRLSYYSGANVFLINTTGRSFELVPVAESESCLVTNDVKTLELVIPELDFLRQNGVHREITLTDEHGLESVGYEFVMDLEPLNVSKDGRWEYYTPVQNFVGRYTFVVNATAGGWPVRLDFVGHNAFLVQAHQDEYHIEYQAFHPRPDGIDRSFFLPPIGMPCTPYDNPTGPFAKAQGHSNRHFGMFMPGLAGDSQRYSVLRDMYTHFNKSCSTVGECSERQSNALRRYKYIQSMNSRVGRKYKLGVNHMLDWSDDERAMVRGGRPSQLEALSGGGGCVPYEKNWTGDVPYLPRNVDLRDQNLVGPPRDQGTCGSCWAFGTIGMLEGQVAKKYGHIIRLSEQHLVDCSWSVGNKACDGGNTVDAQSWLLEKNGGLFPTADSYGRYLSEDGFCHFDKSKHLEGMAGVAAPPPGAQEHITVAGQIKSCHAIAGPEYGGLEAAQTRVNFALYTVGPLSTFISSSDRDFYYYAGGVYDNPACESRAGHLDHVVVITGYGVDDTFSVPYWWIRNSWSTHWGESGYIRVAKENNICGIAAQASFSLLF